MWDYELRSERERKRALAGQPAMYRYDQLPAPLLAQVSYIWNDACGIFRAHVGGVVQDTYIRQTGQRDLEMLSVAGDALEWCRAVLYRLDLEGMLDIIELTFHVIEMEMPEITARYSQSDYDLKIILSPEQAVQELNRRFQQHGVGYQYVGGQLIRVDSQFVHAEIVEPAVALLHEAQFRGPSDEFMRAHGHYRHGRNKDAIRDTLNAFESTMKAICKVRGWTCDPNAPAKKLINTVLAEGLIPPSLQSQFAQLASLLEGLATVRNKMGGHGQGSDVVEVPPHFAAYALNLAAVNIVLLVEAYKALE